jgi:hypothetical protein
VRGLGAFLLDVGISSSFHSLTANAEHPVAAARIGDRATEARTLASVSAEAARQQPVHDEPPRLEVLNGEILDNEAPPNGGSGTHPRRMDIGAMITKALTAAGLMK